MAHGGCVINICRMNERVTACRDRYVSYKGRKLMEVTLYGADYITTDECVALHT